jgi:hypothetical protein
MLELPRFSGHLNLNGGGVHQRRHGSLGYRSPVQYERHLAQLRIA